MPRTSKTDNRHHSARSQQLDAATIVRVLDTLAAVAPATEVLGDALEVLRDQYSHVIWQLRPPPCRFAPAPAAQGRLLLPAYREVPAHLVEALRERYTRLLDRYGRLFQMLEGQGNKQVKQDDEVVQMLDSLANLDIPVALAKAAQQEYATLTRRWGRELPTNFPETSAGENVRQALHYEYLRMLAELASVAPPVSGLVVSDGKVWVDGQVVPLDMTSERLEDALAFLETLVEAEGNWRSSRSIGEATKRQGVRFDRIFRELPRIITSLVESGHKGYRVRELARRD